MKSKLQMLDEAIALLTGGRAPGNKRRALKLLLELREIVEREDRYYSDPDYAIRQAHNSRETM